MLSINLQPQDEYQWLGENPSSDVFHKEDGQYPLYHQWLTYNAEKPLIVNTFNTGTGKTKAALLRLLKRAEDIGFNQLYPTQHNALLIAPTNELLAQHVEDARKFCDDAHLPYRVLALTKADLEEYKNTPGFSEEQLRRGAILHSNLNDPSKLGSDTHKRATLYVVNPDIFYYAVLFCYNQFDRASLFTDFFTLFNYIIIDEFHYYDPKQLTMFLFFMKLSQHMGYIDSYAKKRQFCILTATPNPQVTRYLNELSIPIDWICPGEIDAANLSLVRSVRALTLVQLHVYNTEELQQDDTKGRLLQLVAQHLPTLLTWLKTELDGAIISSSLGMINLIYDLLKHSGVADEEMGRITGAELREGRSESKEKQLIMATPTVDIGYNFNRSKPKPRQNIDFLFFDAFSGDEFIQRLGRAGRVLAKEERDHASIVIAVVEPDTYKLLEKFTAKDLARGTLAQLADLMPKRNDLYAYIKIGAILEVFRPIVLLGQGIADTAWPDLEVFFKDMQALFSVKRPFTYKEAQAKVWSFEERKKHYSRLTTIPEVAFYEYQLMITKKPMTTPVAPQVEKCLSAFSGRIAELYKKQGSLGKSRKEWLHDDLRCYFIDNARFTFRDSFQPPLALIYDEQKLHSSKEVALYNALHIAKYYEASFYESIAEWEQKTLMTVPLDAANAMAYCRLWKLRSTPLQLGLKLDASEYTQDEWEEKFAYRVTALYGMEVVALTDNHGLDTTLQSLVRTQFIPAFVALNNAKSSTASEIRKLQKRARFFPMELNVTFCNAGPCKYLAILGTMAFQVCAEIPWRSIAIDRRKTQLADDSPFIC